MAPKLSGLPRWFFFPSERPLKLVTHAQKQNGPFSEQGALLKQPAWRQSLSCLKADSSATPRSAEIIDAGISVVLAIRSVRTGGVHPCDARECRPRDGGI